MGILSRVKSRASEILVSQALGLLGHAPERTYEALAKALRGIAVTEQHRMIADWLIKWFSEGSPGSTWLRRVLRDLHPNVRKRYLAQMLTVVTFRHPESMAEYRRKYGFRPPSVMLVSPTMRCNYRCVGCYAANYTKKDDMPPELLDRILNEAKEITIRFVTVLGGEPFIYDHLFDILERHQDMAFQIFTNGALIDEKTARRLAELGNAGIMVSLEGFAEETDLRRGSGAFQRAIRAMEILRDAGCLVGFSAVATRRNIDVLTSDEFVDMLVDKGCLYGWIFLYMPVGHNPDPDLMPTPEQRNQLRLANKRFRETKPILIADFWNDAPLTGGCINGGRTYFHINHKGDVEPCIFIHFATDNIKEKSLVEALNSPFFKALRRMQPFCYNTLRPCPIIDHPKILRTVVRRFNAYPTHEGAESILEGRIAEALDRYAQRVKEIFDPIWEEEYKWAERWEELMDFPEGRVATRRAGYLRRRAREKALMATSS